MGSYFSSQLGLKCLPGQSVPADLSQVCFGEELGHAQDAHVPARGIGCRGWGVGGASVEHPKPNMPETKTNRLYLNQKGNNPNVKYMYYSEFQSTLPKQHALYSKQETSKAC